MLMLKHGVQCPSRAGRAVCLLAFLFLSALHGRGLAQTASEKPFYSRANTFGVFAAYSNDSSHMLLGYAERRKLLSLGAAYDRRLWIGQIANWQYSAEILPVALESDPVSWYVNVQTSPTEKTFAAKGETLISCAPIRTTYDYQVEGITYAGTTLTYCRGRQWTVGQAISPVGMQLSFLPRRKLQPLIEGHGGYMYTTRPIPVDYAGSFNFMFDFGAGVEWFQSRTRSFQLEYRYHHLSNADTAEENPGIDNGLFQLRYAFGR